MKRIKGLFICPVTAASRKRRYIGLIRNRFFFKTGITNGSFSSAYIRPRHISAAVGKIQRAAYKSLCNKPVTVTGFRSGFQHGFLSENMHSPIFSPFSSARYPWILSSMSNGLNSSILSSFLLFVRLCAGSRKYMREPPAGVSSRHGPGEACRLDTGYYQFTLEACDLDSELLAHSSYLPVSALEKRYFYNRSVVAC